MVVSAGNLLFREGRFFSFQLVLVYSAYLEMFDARYFSRSLQVNNYEGLVHLLVLAFSLLSFNSHRGAACLIGPFLFHLLVISTLLLLSFL